ncbi:hypothetical protein ALP29_201452 [Pseudomonas syringae pv. avii]|uniref:Uncharacterized protein n=1 Tax=Pseudomonas syringae pv. avii TaxID=663959 RepID=A0A3M5WAV5_PSESX|nr:hypothetical protein ALP29_201452 [Pseudomonas syringae pv. avii]
MFVRPKVKPAVITVHPAALALYGGALGTPDQRPVSEQPDRTALMAAHGGAHGCEQLLAGELWAHVDDGRVRQTEAVMHCSGQLVDWVLHLPP